MLIVFFLFLRSWIVSIIISSSWSHYWTSSSSSSIVQSYVSFSNNYATVLTCFSISASWSETSIFLFSRTSGGDVGLIFSFISSTSCLYWSIVYTMRLIFSSALLFASCVLFKIRLYVAFNPCSILSMHSFSSSISILTYLTTNYNASFPLFVCFNYVAYVHSCNYTSCVAMN
jgi:hypothetical protein